MKTRFSLALTALLLLGLCAGCTPAEVSPTPSTTATRTPAPAVRPAATRTPTRTMTALPGVTHVPNTPTLFPTDPTPVIDRQIKLVKEYEYGSTDYAISADRKLIGFGWFKESFQPTYDRRPSIQLVDLDTGELIEEIIKPAPLEAARSGAMTFSYDGKYIVTTGNSGNILVWDLEQHQFIENVLINPDSYYECILDTLAYTTIPGVVVVMPRNECNKVMFWDIDTNSEYGTLEIQPASIDVHLPKNTMVTSTTYISSDEIVIQLWNIDGCTPDCLPVREFRIDTSLFGYSVMSDIEFSPSGKVIAGVIGNHLSFWGVDEMAEIQDLSGETIGVPIQVVFVTEETVAVLNKVGEIFLVEYLSGDVTGKVLTDEAVWIDYLPDRDELLTGNDGKTQIWEVP